MRIPDRSSPARRLLLWSGVFALWSLPALVALSYYYLTQTVTAQSLDWRYALITTLPNWYLWALFTPLVVLVARKVRPVGEREGLLRWGPVLLAHGVLLLLLMAIHAAVQLAMFTWMGLHEEATLGLYQIHFGVRLHSNALAYIALAGAVYAVDFYRRYRAREQEAALLEGELAKAQLQALRMQLQPHFLFNTLHAVGSMVRMGEADTSVRMLGRLGEFLRMVLDQEGEQTVPLRQELAFVRCYLDIEQVRFQERLHVTYHIDPAAEPAYVPNLILQPLVENAVKHGIAPYARAGTIQISARARGSALTLQVTDDGPGLSGDGAPPQPGHGIGLANTRARLQHLYGDEHHVSMASSPHGGTAVTIRLPLQFVEPALTAAPVHLRSDTAV